MGTCVSEVDNEASEHLRRRAQLSESFPSFSVIYDEEEIPEDESPTLGTEVDN